MNITRHDGDAPAWLIEAIQRAAGAELGHEHPIRLIICGGCEPLP